MGEGREDNTMDVEGPEEDKAETENIENMDISISEEDLVEQMEVCMDRAKNEESKEKEKELGIKSKRGQNHTRAKSQLKVRLHFKVSKIKSRGERAKEVFMGSWRSSWNLRETRHL